MRVIQIIDSLDAGGAERMAVNYANALGSAIEFSGLVITRKEGALMNQIDKNVSYLFLNKKRAIDLGALFRLRSFIIQNKVEFVHAHSTSFFIAFLLKLVYPSVRLIWHDHYGDSEFLSKRPENALKMVMPFFSGIIAVNQTLKIWAEQSLKFSNVIYLPNFPSEEKEILEHTILNGTEGKRIVSLANLREQKDHFLLLDVAQKLKISHPEWTFHLVGKDFGDGYSQQIKNRIVKFYLEKNVFLYGTKPDIKNILAQSDIGILTSQSEGLPVAILEYGWYKKPVVVTTVGEISSLIQDGINGFLVNCQNRQAFYNKLVQLIEKDNLRLDFGAALHKTILLNYSEESVIKKYLNWLQDNQK